MSKLKRALSLVLCFAMLAGIFGVAANSIAPLVSAADDTAGESRIDSYKDLDAAYDNFVYVGTEFWEYPRDIQVEKDGETVTEKTKFALTDWYVDPGQILQMRLFIKSDRYVGTGTVSISLDTNFFDLTKGTGSYPNGVVSSTTLYDGTTLGVNAAHEGVAADGVNFNRSSYATTEAGASAVNSGYLVIPETEHTFNAGTADETKLKVKLAGTSFTQWVFLKDTTIDRYVWICDDDAWIFADDVYVKTGLADDTVGYTFLEPRLYKYYDLNELMSKGSRPHDIKTTDVETTAAAAAKSLATRAGQTVTAQVDHFLTSDTFHTFTIGEPKPATLYKATFSYENNGATLTKEVTDLKTGATVTLPAGIEHSKEGYSFKGWTTVKDDASTLVEVANMKIVDTDVVYYAYYTANPVYPVTYVDENGAVIGEAEQYENGETYTIKALKDIPAKPGYNPLGWSTVKDDATAIVTGEQTMGTAGVTLYPIYEIGKFTVTFRSNEAKTYFSNGTTEFKITKEYNTVIDASDVETLNRDGYDFAGWATDKAATSGITEGTVVTVPDNNTVVFYATWKAKDYKVTAYASEADYKAGTVLEEKTANNNVNFALTEKITVPADKKLLGWVDASAPKGADGNYVFFSTAANAGVNFKSGKDIEIYPVFGDYAYSVTYKVWDYANEEWKTFGDVIYTDKATLSRTDLNKVRNTINVETDLGLPGCEVDHPFASSGGLVNLYLGMDTTGAGCVAETDLGNGQSTDGAAVIVDMSKEETADDITIYIYTVVKFNITNNTAEFVDDKYTGNTITTTETYVPLNTDSNKKEFTRVINKDTLTSPDKNYKFIGFTDANGDTITPIAETATTYTLALNAEDGSNIVINNVYGPRTYTLQFTLDNGDTIVAKTPVVLGDSIDLASLEYEYSAPAEKAGQAATLPVVGKTGDEQTPAVNGKAGYEFKGWYFTRLEATPETFPVEVTEELLADVLYADSNDDIIRIMAIWEAKTYTAKFYYKNADGTDAEPITVDAKVDAALSTFAPADEETISMINEKAPEGYVFTRWAAKDGSNATEMTAGGREYVAVYSLKAYRVYVDYNNGKTNEDGSIILKDSGSVTYGEDVEFGDADYQAAGFTIRTESFGRTNANLPSEDAVHMGWKVFYVADPADVTNPEKWVEGYNANGDGTKAYSTIIYQAQWKTYDDFLIMVNDTEGYLFFALGKDFSLNYWKNNRACDRDTAEMKPNPDDIILFFQIDFSNGFTLTPFAVNSSLFTLEGIIGLFQALGNAISGLLADLFEDIELPSFDFGGGEGEGSEGEGGGFDISDIFPC